MQSTIYHRQVSCQAELQRSVEVLGTCSSGSETSAPPGQPPLHTCRNKADPILASLHHLRSSVVVEKSSYVTQNNSTAAYLLMWQPYYSVTFWLFWTNNKELY